MLGSLSYWFLLVCAMRLVTRSLAIGSMRQLKTLVRSTEWQSLMSLSLLTVITWILGFVARVRLVSLVSGNRSDATLIVMSVGIGRLVY